MTNCKFLVILTIELSITINYYVFIRLATGLKQSINE